MKSEVPEVSLLLSEAPSCSLYASTDRNGQEEENGVEAKLYPS